MRVLLASADDPLDPTAWSGTAFQVRRALLNGGHLVEIVGGMPTVKNPVTLFARLVLGPRRAPLWMTRSSLKRLATRLEDAERRFKPDLIVSISSQYLVYANVEAPTILFSDAPWESWHAAYKPFERFPIRSKWYERLERFAAVKATALAFTTEWAKKEAIARFTVPEEKVSVIPLGANWTPTESGNGSYRTNSGFHFLFVGRDWERKGGATAVRIVAELRRRGHDARLTVIGPNLQPAELDLAPWLVYVDRIELSGRHEQDSQSVTMPSLFSECDALLVPSRAECFGIVYAEAFAFGKPAIALDVQGVQEIVQTGNNGCLLETGDSLAAMADRVEPLLTNRETYAHLSSGALRSSQQLFNWAEFGLRFNRLAEAIRLDCS